MTAPPPPAPLPPAPPLPAPPGEDQAVPFPFHPHPDQDDAPLERDLRSAVAGLRTAAPGRTDPTPIVTLAGVQLVGATDMTGGWPIALDDLSVDWGRDAVMDQPTPATASVRLFDPSGRWATGRDLVGQPLNLAWSAMYPDPAETTPRTAVFFRGRVTAATITRNPTRDHPAGVLIDLGASSILTDLGNRVPFEAWPEETLGARRVRLGTWVAGPVSTVMTRDYWDAAHLAPVTASNQGTVLNSLTDLYDSAGPDRMTYLPDTQVVAPLVRRDAQLNTTAQLGWRPVGVSPTNSRTGLGAYISCRSIASSLNYPLAWTGGWVDCANVEFDGQLSKDITSRITRVEVAHKDSLSTPTTFADRVETALVPGAWEPSIGVRALRHESQVCWNNYAQTAAGDLAAMAAAEGSGWTAGQLTYRADLAGGFDYFGQVADLLLTGAEQQGMVFFQRSWFAELGIRPVFGVIGGTIRYAEGWSVEMTILPVSTPLPQHAIAWDEIDDGTTATQLQWQDDDHPRGLHSSVTYEDIGFVGMGLGVTTAPTNPVWDEVYSQ